MINGLFDHFKLHVLRYDIFKFYLLLFHAKYHELKSFFYYLQKKISTNVKENVTYETSIQVKNTWNIIIIKYVSQRWVNTWDKYEANKGGAKFNVITQRRE